MPAACRPWRGVLLPATLALLACGPAHAATPDGDPATAAPSIRLAARDFLRQCAQQAVQRLARPGGFAANPQARIGMPPALRESEKLLRRLGGKKEMEAFLTAMNETAEALAAKAEPLLMTAIQAAATAGPAGGSPCAAFRAAHEAALLGRLQPLAREMTEDELIDRAYRRVVKQSARFGYLRGEAPPLHEYLAQQTLNGLFQAMAEAEKTLYARRAGLDLEEIAGRAGASARSRA